MAEAALPRRPQSAAASKPLVVFVHGSADLYGSDKVLLYLAESLLISAAFAPLVVIHEDGPLRRQLELAGVEVHVATVVKISRAMFRPSALLRLPVLASMACRDLDRIVGGRRVGLVHSNTLAVLGGAWWALRRGHAHLWHVHEIILNPKPVRTALPRLADRFSRWVISNSEPTQRWLLETAPRLARHSSVIVNGLPPPPPCVDAAVAAFRSRAGATPQSVLVTVAGRLNAWKGQGLAIEAFALLKRQRRLGSLRLALVGSCVPGQEHIRVDLERQIHDAGLEDDVCLIDFVDDIYSVWRASDLALVPSIEPEPFGMVAIEAMACGLPVVAARHGGLVDIVVDARTGLLFEPRNVAALAQALDKLGTDVGMRTNFGRAGRQRQSEHFSLQRQIDETHALYSRIAT